MTSSLATLSQFIPHSFTHNIPSQCITHSFTVHSPPDHCPLIIPLTTPHAAAPQGRARSLESALDAQLGVNRQLMAKKEAVEWELMAALAKVGAGHTGRDVCSV